ncbi:MAG: hypothetical protein EBT79_07480 [Actinobacteria bacterium]|nr:hypothetical protein [Actinomycetota bacterium]NBR67100.1 hypothetical protein [Actinomycetota bacterium]
MAVTSVQWWHPHEDPAVSHPTPIFAIHDQNSAIPHTFDVVPVRVFASCRVGEDVCVFQFVNLGALPAHVRDILSVEVMGAASAIAHATVTRPVVADETDRVENESTTVVHTSLDSFVDAIADCREAGGDLLPCDNPRHLMIGYVHHPVEGESVVHEVALRNIKGTVLSDEVAARIGMTPAEVREHLKTHEGRETLATGHPPEPATTPEQDAELAAAMLAAPLRVAINGDDSVEFPDLDLFQDVTEGMVDVVTERNGNFRPYSPRPAWVPAGWSILTFPDDAKRAGVLNDESPDGATGAFARRGDHLFRAFADGRWDESTWHPPVDADGGRYIPGGYRVHRSGYVGKADIVAALDAVLPYYHATPPAVVRGGAP